MKILIIDDQILFAEGMKSLVEQIDPDAGSAYAKNIDSGLSIILEGLHPDLILLDINLTGIYDYCLIDQLKKLELYIPVLIVSTFESASSIGIAIEKGAAGFILKSSEREKFIDAIKVVLSGNTYLPKQNEFFNHEEELEGLGRVTYRQQEILYLLSQGLLNKQIASELCISANTVKAHLQDLFKHLNAIQPHCSSPESKEIWFIAITFLLYKFIQNRYYFVKGKPENF